MGILGGLLSNLEGGGASEQHQAVTTALLQHLASNSSGNGLLGLLQGFHNAGMSDKVNSWVSNGPNEPVSPDQVQQGLGPDFISQIASRAGLSPTVAKIALAAVLPAVVNHLTPQGRVEQGGGLQQIISGFLKRSA